jgi:hypothetical protein
VNTLNKAAHELNPPHEQIRYSNVMDMAFLSQFELLQHSRSGHDIRKEPWADPATRVLTDKYYELLRAKEEITRLNVEWCRVRSWLVDEKHLYKVINLLASQSDSLLLGAVQCRWTQVKQTHQLIRYWLYRTQRLPSFSGDLSQGHAQRQEHMGIAGLLDSCNLDDDMHSNGDSQQETDDDIEDSQDHINSVGMEGCLDENPEFDSLVSTIGCISM